MLMIQQKREIRLARNIDGDEWYVVIWACMRNNVRIQLFE